MKVKIAVVQFEINQYNPDKNLSKAEKFIAEASESKADIIVFPEDFLSGGLNDDEIVKLADSEGKYRKIFQALAKKYKIDIVAGSIIERNRIGNFNVCYYIDSTGKIKGKYRKINLWLTERKRVVPGTEIAVFNTKFGKIGLIICWDLMFPEIFRKMLRKGVNIVICPSYWTFEDASIGLKWDKNSDPNLVDSLCVGRAFENEIILVYANAVGKLTLPNFDGTLFGHSQITVPFIGAVHKLNHQKEKMFIQEVDTNILKDAERAYKIRYDIKNRLL